MKKNYATISKSIFSVAQWELVMCHNHFALKNSFDLSTSAPTSMLMFGCKQDNESDYLMVAFNHLRT